MSLRPYRDRLGRAKLWVSPDEFSRQRTRARRLRLRMAQACQLAGLPPTSFGRWSTAATAPDPDSWSRLDATLGAAERGELP